MTVRSFVECRQRCRDQRGCQAFTFVDEWELNCFLKADKGEESEFEGGTIQAVGVTVSGEPYENLELEAKRLMKLQ